MNDKPYTKSGMTYYPKKKAPLRSSSEVRGNLWRAWLDEDGKAFLEYDAGHFATKMRIVEITNDDFNLVRSGEITETQLVRKYHQK